MEINISEQMCEVLEKAVRFALSKNAWISATDQTGDYEVTLDDALEFLSEIKA